MKAGIGGVGAGFLLGDCFAVFDDADAKLLGISDRHVRRLMDAGDLEGRRMTVSPRSRRVIYGRSVLAFLEKRAQI